MWAVVAAGSVTWGEIWIWSVAVLQCASNSCTRHEMKLYSFSDKHLLGNFAAGRNGFGQSDTSAVKAAADVHVR